MCIFSIVFCVFVIYMYAVQKRGKIKNIKILSYNVKLYVLTFLYRGANPTKLQRFSIIMEVWISKFLLFSTY